jgi:hypothetical protein
MNTFSETKEIANLEKRLEELEKAVSSVAPPILRASKNKNK